MPRAVQAIIPISNPQAMFTVGHIGPTANNWVPVNTHITGSESTSLSGGVLIKNIGPLSFGVMHTGATHGSSNGFRLFEGDQIFVESTSLSSIMVKNITSNQGICMSVYAG